MTSEQHSMTHMLLLQNDTSHWDGMAKAKELHKSIPLKSQVKNHSKIRQKPYTDTSITQRHKSRTK